MKKIILPLLLLVAVAFLFSQINPLTVQSPNGGEIWAVNTTQTISWTTTLTSGTVMIQLRRATSTASYITIANNVAVTALSFNWTIPATIPPASDYKVRITLLFNTNPTLTAFDDSNGFFSIVNNTNPTPSITVLSPNGGEIWQIGNTYPITWHFNNLTGNVRIELVSPSMSPIANIVAETPIENGVYNWTIPATITPASFYLISITWVSMLTVYFGDVSDAAFTISSGTMAPSISILSPNGGENWLKGTSHPIIWNSSNLTGNIQILLVGINPVNTSSFVIAADIPNTGSFVWSIPAAFPSGSGYKVLIRSLANNTVFDVSDNPFTISDIFVSRIRVISPNGGEVWHQGTTRAIRWLTTSNFGNVEISLFRGGTSVQVPYIVSASTPNNGIFNWTIPSTIPNGRNYKIRIRCLDNIGSHDISDNYFAIVNNMITITDVLCKSDKQVSFSLQISGSNPISVSIYNIRGQVVRKILSNEFINDTRQIAWDGHNETGKAVKNGIYFIKAQAGNVSTTKRFILK